jgi:hypothetical protein
MDPTVAIFNGFLFTIDMEEKERIVWFSRKRVFWKWDTPTLKELWDQASTHHYRRSSMNIKSSTMIATRNISLVSQINFFFLYILNIFWQFFVGLATKGMGESFISSSIKRAYMLAKFPYAPVHLERLYT